MKRLAAGLAVLVWASATVPVAAVPLVPAAVHSGTCQASEKNAVTIVIDYQDLGGGVKTYCVSNLTKPTTGLGALTAAGVSFQGTTSDGSAFVCRINGRPSATETMTLPNGDKYTEKCVTSPPGSAYWSYWTAKPGGSWSYASQGAASRQVVFGSYEGWSFSLGGGIGKAPRPRMVPVAWKTPASSKPSSKGSKSSTKPLPSRTPTRSSSSPSKLDRTTPTSQTTAGQSSFTPSPSPGLPSSPASQTLAPAPQTLAPAPTDPPVSDPGGGANWPLSLGLSMIGVLGVVGGVIWFRRRKPES